MSTISALFWWTSLVRRGIEAGTQPRNAMASLRIATSGRDLFWVPFFAFLLSTIEVVSLPSLALADFRLCNNTGSRVGVAIGFKDGEGWITEGWWNLSSRTCETILRGTLVARFYYVYAVDYDRGGEWSGKAFMCTRDKEFTIRGVEDCLARGFERTGFFEVDTGEQRSWTVQLTESTEQAPARPLQPQAPTAPTAPTAPVAPGNRGSAPQSQAPAAQQTAPTR
jgi:uncharacterized membrane protein